MKLVIGSLLAVALPFAAAYADGDHPHHKPPQAAFDACAKAKEGDACSVAFHDHTMTGVCKPAHDSSALVCHPDHPPGPPAEAVAACSAHAVGDTCSWSHDGRDLAGTCVQHDAQGPVACMPKDMPHPHS